MKYKVGQTVVVTNALDDGLEGGGFSIGSKIKILYTSRPPQSVDFNNPYYDYKTQKNDYLFFAIRKTGNLCYIKVKNVRPLTKLEQIL